MAFDSTSLLKISNSELFSQFLHQSVDLFIGRTCSENERKRNDYECTEEDCERARKVIQNLYKDSVTKNEETLEISIKELGATAVEAIRDCFEIRKHDMLRVLAQEQLSKHSPPVVENIDWKVKWVLGSSRLASLREPLLQVDLHCLKNPNEDRRQTVSFEMNLDQIDKLIAVLEKVRSEKLERTD